jgi:hypothetical protein
MPSCGHGLDLQGVGTPRRLAAAPGEVAPAGHGENGEGAGGDGADDR